MAIKTLSIPADLDEFLAANTDLSPSKMLQSKIIEIRENRRINFKEIITLNKRIKFLQRQLWEANEKIDNLQKENAKLIPKKDK